MGKRSLIVLTLLGSAVAGAAVPERAPGLYDHLVLQREGGLIPIRGIELERLPAGDPQRQAWSELRDELGGDWKVWLDERTALPALVLIRDHRWRPEERARELDNLDDYATLARNFMKENPSVAGPFNTAFELDREASGRRGADVWHVRFSQSIDGVRVEGARFEFHVAHGNLVAMGSRLWAPVRISAVPELTATEAWSKLDAYVRPVEGHGVVDLRELELLLVPINADPSTQGAWRGMRGAGVVHRLVWRFQFTDFAGIASWTGEVDAHNGEIVAFWDATQYDRIKGAVNPFTDDGPCIDQGCPVPDFPMPYVGYTENGGAVQYANSHGLYECVIPGATIETTLDGQYFRMVDSCGPITETTTCDGELDLGMADGINCGVASGASAGNTDAARTAYYHLNQVNAKARFWMSGNTWLDSTVQTNTNTGSGCNAGYGGGQIFLQVANASCGNTGQQQGLITHEWGHGLDDNDGGGADNPGEGYADIVALIEGRQSCIARGFNKFNLCPGFGDTCLTCTGLREMDWDARQAHTPATPSGFLATFCPNGTGPCGSQVHCESHVSSEAIYDLAVRDLPAMGLDVDTAWQLIDRLWYQSRPGSGGDAYNCTGPDSDSCSVGSWYHQLRLQDDDDGNLANGTPHAAAIFAAFDRHDIACGLSTDPENLNTSSCPALAAPVASFTTQTNAIDLQWTSVTDAATYRVYRNAIGCQRAQVPITEVAAPGTSFLDGGLANGVPVSYRVQAVGANAACESPVSNCLQATPQQLAGRVRFNPGAYACDGSALGVEVTDINHPTSSMTVSVYSDTEPTPESVTLNETSPGSARFTGSIQSTNSAAAADGQLSIAGGDTITAEYVDLDDGAGGMNVVQQAIALADCSGPLHIIVQVNTIAESTAIIDWTTSELTTGQLEWGLTPALGTVVVSPMFKATHSAEIGPFNAACDRVYFRITSTDGVGNVGVADVAGAPFEFNSTLINGVLYSDGFETDAGWTLEGEWEILPPQGLGSSPGDPTSASEGTRVLGQDLRGRGANPGDYEPFTTDGAISPVIDASSWTNVELHFDRWLNTHVTSLVTVDVKDSSGAWQAIWSDTDDGHIETSWNKVSYDVSQAAAGNPNFQIRFFTFARFGNHAGWNVDRLFLRDGDTPLHIVCGGCTGAPTFAGLVSAIDVDPCTDTGIQLDWVAAPAWGTGSAGSYSVYRDVTPGVTPSGANLIASGVTTTTWTDTTAPANTPVYYVVRAENDETCSAGPANSGVTETNLIEMPATNVTGAPGSGPVGDTLGVNRSATDVHLTWADVPGATQYTVERSSSADTGFTIVSQPAAAVFDDPGALTDGQTWYYLVTNSNACTN